MPPNHDGAITRFVANEIRHRETSCHHRSLPLMMLASVCCFAIGCQSLQKKTSQQSASCGALCRQAHEAREQGNSDQANRYIDEALRQKPSDVETRRQLAETMWNNGRRAEALVLFKSLCTQQPKDAKLSARLAVMLWENDEHAEAANAAMTVLQLDPQSKAAWLVRGRIEAENGHLDEALSSYIRLSQLAPDDLSTMIELGDLHLKRGHPDRACPLFRAAIQQTRANPEQRAEIEWKLGVALARNERWSLAIPLLETASSRRTPSADDWCFLSWTRLQSGDVAGAENDLKRAFECDPESLAARKLAKQLEASIDSESPPDFVTPVRYVESP